MNSKQKLIQTAGELLIPILGFYAWSWNLNFIFLFYFIDLFAYQIFTFIKWRKMASFWGLIFSSKTFLFFNALFAVGLAIIIFIEIAISFVYPSLNLGVSLLKFLTYAEWGIPQVVMLIPLVVLANYQQYKMLFVGTGKFRRMSEVQLKKNALFSLILLLLASLIFILFSFFGLTNPQIWLWITVLSKTTFDLWIFPLWENRTKNA
jgi:hypothetical protein